MPGQASLCRRMCVCRAFAPAALCTLSHRGQGFEMIRRVAPCKARAAIQTCSCCSVCSPKILAGVPDMVNGVETKCSKYLSPLANARFGQVGMCAWQMVGPLLGIFC